MADSQAIVMQTDKQRVMVHENLKWAKPQKELKPARVLFGQLMWRAYYYLKCRKRISDSNGCKTPVAQWRAARALAPVYAGILNTIIIISLLSSYSFFARDFLLWFFCSAVSFRVALIHGVQKVGNFWKLYLRVAICLSVSSGLSCGAQHVTYTHLTSIVCRESGN